MQFCHKFRGISKCPVVKFWFFLNFGNKSVGQQGRGLNGLLGPFRPQVHRSEEDERREARPAPFLSLQGERPGEERLRWFPGRRRRAAEKGPARGARGWRGRRPVRGRPSQRGKRLLQRGGVGRGGGGGRTPAGHGRSLSGVLGGGRGRAGEGKAETERARSGAPARAALKLRLHNPSPRAAANGTRASAATNHGAASSRRGPMAARVLGAWAKQAAPASRVVCVGWGWRRRPSWPRWVRTCARAGGLLCPASAWLCVRERVRCSAALLPGGSRETRRRQRGPPLRPRARPESERAGVSGGWEGCGPGASPPRCRSSWKTPRS